MTRLRKTLLAGLCVALAASAVMPVVLRGSPAGTAPATGRGARKFEPIMQDLQKEQEATSKVMPSLLALADADFRKNEGPKVVGHLRKMADLLQELENSPDLPVDKSDVRSNRYHFLGFAAALGDADAVKMLEEQAKGKDDEAVAAKSALVLGRWVQAPDAAAQQKVLESYTPTAKENPTSDEVAQTLGVLANLGAANNEVTKSVIAVMRDNLKGPAAKQMIEQLQGQQDQLAMVGKPLTIEGRTSTGGTFSSADYKGKVVLLDFWATWCGPCVEELPNVKKAYADMHGQGFEIVGVSCDANDEVLNKFTATNSMPWVQLRESSQNEQESWHPLTRKFHIDGIPTMFLIDRNGVLRFVDGREDLTKKVKDLLAEPVAPAASTPPATAPAK